MKRLVLLLLVLDAGATSTRADVRFGGGAHTGLSFSSFPGTLSQYYGVGYGVGVNGDLNIIEPLTIRLNLDYSRFPSDKTRLSGLYTVKDPFGNPVPFEVSGFDASILSITTNVIGRIPTGSIVRPYGILGLGLHFLGANDFKLVASGQTLLERSAGDSLTRFGLNFGAGTEFLIGSARLFVEAKYVLIFTENTTSHIPLTFGVSF